MKKQGVYAALLLTVMVTLAGCGRGGSDSGKATNGTGTNGGKTSQTEGNLISEEEAKKIALEHAGITEDGTTFIKVKLERDDGVQEYEIEFYTQDTEYDYNVDAVTGDIRSYDNELENHTGSTPQEEQGAITIEEATALALEKVPGAGDTNIRIKEDRDDGRSVYEGTILYENKEYDFEIDAATGEFNEWDQD